jgi:hypothetical protein
LSVNTLKFGERTGLGKSLSHKLLLLQDFAPSATITSIWPLRQTFK